jgi:hypothetical protein
MPNPNGTRRVFAVGSATVTVIDGPAVLRGIHWSPLRGRVIWLSFIVVLSVCSARASVDRRRRLSIAL